MATAKRILQAAMPPALWRLGQEIQRRLLHSADHASLAPAGWNTPVPDQDNYWEAFLPEERTGFTAIAERIQAGESLLAMPSDEHLKYLTFGYVLGRLARARPALSVLDYGGNLGEYSMIGSALLPGIHLDYHCKELPRVVETGRALNPDVTWHTDDSCLDRNYDLVMFSSSLQYLSDWQDVSRRAANAARHVFLSDVPTVRDTASFVAKRRAGGMSHLHGVLNRGELLATMRSAGLTILEEFAMGPHPAVANAPEQPLCAGWLFARTD